MCEGNGCKDFLAVDSGINSHMSLFCNA